MRNVVEYWPGRVMFTTIAFGVAMSIPFGFLPEYVDEVKADGGVGIFFLGYGGWGFCVRVGLRRLPDRWGLERSLFVGLLFIGIGHLAFLAIDASNAWAILLPGVLGGTGHALAFPSFTSLTIAPFPRHTGGTAAALSLFLLDLGMVGGAPVLGWIAASAGFDALFATVGVTTIVSAFLFTPRRRTVRATEATPDGDGIEAAGPGEVPRSSAPASAR